jgi:metal-responsive CopG/Arc/MetJ family transcriptional regulator
MSKETPAKMGRPSIESEHQLKPRFTLNLSDTDYARFQDAVHKSRMKRSEFARKAILQAVADGLTEK